MNKQKDWVELETPLSREDKSVLEVLITIVDTKIEMANKILKKGNIKEEFVLLRRIPKKKTSDTLLSNY